jgi:hypothetical protein
VIVVRCSLFVVQFAFRPQRLFNPKSQIQNPKSEVWLSTSSRRAIRRSVGASLWSRFVLSSMGDHQTK